MLLKNYKTLMKENVDKTNRWKDMPCSWIGRIKVIKMSMLPNASEIQYRTRTNNSKICMDAQNTPNSQNNLEKKNKPGDIMLPDFKLQC